GLSAEIHRAARCDHRYVPDRGVQTELAEHADRLRRRFMTTHVALIRGINVGGHKLVGMADLREMLTALGFAGARSLLQSGNLIFQGRTKSAPRLEAMLEAEAGKRLALQADFFIRTADELKAVVDGNPFPREAARDPARLVVVFLKTAPDAKAVETLRA